MRATVVYDGNCNFCTVFVRILEKLDQGKQFYFVPMQDSETLRNLGISAAEMAKGVILLEAQERYQGSDAIERIGTLLPGFQEAIAIYRQIPGMKPIGDLTYGFVRDHRYALFGKRAQTYQSIYPLCTDRCEQEVFNQ